MTNQLPAKGDRKWGDTLNNWLGQLSPASLGGIHNGDTASRPAGLTADDEGKIYIDTESQELIRWDGSAWQILLTGNVEQKFNITAKTADYTITATEAETGLNGFSNDGASGIVKFTLPDAVAGMKVTIVNAESDKLVQVYTQDNDVLITNEVPNGKTWLRSSKMTETLIFHAVNNNKWVVKEDIPATGYFAGGGGDSGDSDAIVGLDFASEYTISISSILSVARWYGAGVNSSEKGYFAGGFSNLSSIDAIKFSDESTTNPSISLIVGRRGLSGVNSSEKGYFGGGGTPSYTNEVDGIDFATESIINPSMGISPTRYVTGSVNSSERGYFAGGNTGSSDYNDIDGIRFSDETRVDPSATLSVPRRDLAGVSSTTNGYFIGGNNNTTKFSTIDGIQFSDETAINPAAALSVAKTYIRGSNSNTAGYTAGGNDGNFSSSIDKFDFSSETASLLQDTLEDPIQLPAGCQSGGIL